MKEYYMGFFKKLFLTTLIISSFFFTIKSNSQEGSGQILFKTADGIKYPIQISAVDLLNGGQNVYTISGFTNEPINFGPFSLDNTLFVDEFTISEGSKVVLGNPSGELEAYLSIAQNSNVVAKVYDVKGRLISVPKITIEGDVAHLYDPLTDVSPGVYFVKVSGAKSDSFKFIKSKNQVPQSSIKHTIHKQTQFYKRAVNYKISWNGIDLETAIQDVEILNGESNDIIIDVSKAAVLNEGLIYTNVSIELPEAATYSADNLALASLFTEGELVINNQGKVVVFDENTMEMAFATNAQGEIILLSYLNPSITDNLILNSESTAVALVLMHPWTFDLSMNAKQEAIEYIKNIPEFNSYLLSIENSIASNELNPLGAQVILDKVAEIQNIVVKDLNENVTPLNFNITGTTAKVKNVNSSASYSVGLYDQNDVLLEHKLAKGQDKIHSIFQDFVDSKLDSSEVANQTASFDISDGQYNLIAKSGLSFDLSVDNLQAAYYNTTNLAGAVIGIISGNLKKIIIKSDCYITIGEQLYNGPTGFIGLKGSIESFKNGTRSGLLLTIDVILLIKGWADKFSDAVEKCSPGYVSPTEGGFKFVPGVFGKFFQILDLIGRAESAFNGGALLADWWQYDKEIEYCFTKNGTVINECTDLLSISAISPIVQILRPNEDSPLPLIVKVTDANGYAVAGREVFWRTIGLGSSITASSVTDSNGEATASWTLGTYWDESQFYKWIDGNQAYPYIIDASGNEISVPTPFYGKFMGLRLLVSGYRDYYDPISGSVTFEIGGNSGTFTVTNNIITGGTPHLALPMVLHWMSFPEMTSVEGTVTTSFNRAVNCGLEIWPNNNYSYQTHIFYPAGGYIIRESGDPNQTYPIFFHVNQN